jgi:hypothetical protein
LPPGSSVHLFLYGMIPDASVPLDKFRWPPGLTLRVQGPDPVLATLRRVPVVARWVPPLRYVDWGHLAVYRITLLTQPVRRCMSICDDGVMVDTVAQ